MPHKALVLFSGGLDSILAAKLLQEQGEMVEAVHLRLPFTRSATRDGLARVESSAAQIGARLHILEPDEELAEIVTRPKFGYGKNLNPCQDCRIYQLRKAAALMRDIGADYLATGEVLGQRPMSQRRDALSITDREAGLKGWVLRPLSAQLLPPTIPEERGWVDRRRLLALAGRGRTVQEAMARERGLAYPSPAGGCLLTYRESAGRGRNLLDVLGRLSLAGISLIGLGRHFRLSPEAVAIVGRRREENLEIARLFRRHPGRRFLLQTAGVPGPLTLVLGSPGPGEIDLAAAVTARYADLEGAGPVTVKILSGDVPAKTRVEVYRATEAELAPMRIG